LTLEFGFVVWAPTAMCASSTAHKPHTRQRIRLSMAHYGGARGR
jgi:hypothetical protein